mmetsp:Transcript_8999/g.15089  ORF Transcript_8999/g.15089 Transcript_8999/m.15089 type:complete len:241 (-) Transcript_8999:174-896(-)
MFKLSESIVAILIASTTVFVELDAFAPSIPRSRTVAFSTSSSSSPTTLFESTDTESVFVPPEEASSVDEFDKIESLGRGSAKARRGKRKGGQASASGGASKRKAAATLAPEEVYYEGPPAISETFFPTLSIVFVVGIVPAIASWARQAWVRYKITTRRIRVTSGIGGNDMAEIVYPDVVELRTAKRLFGDGDMVLFLRDGAKFEMRNIPEFDDAVEFVLKQLDPDVVTEYRAKGDVTKAP